MADSAPLPAPRPRRKPQSGVVIPNQPRWFQRVAAALIYLVERSLMMTLRVRWEDRAGVATGDRQAPMIYCLWHNRLALCMVVWRNYVRRHLPGKGLAAIISASKDGALLAATLEQFGVLPVRGSSSRRGARALMELTTALKDGYNVAITPDGPRGPCYQVQPGVVTLAQLTGLAIVPISFHAHWKITFKSWDRFQLPLPFSRCDIIIGEPMRFPREATEAERETLRQQLETRLKAISRD